MSRSYSNPNAFAQALKVRVKRRAREMGVGFNRVLQTILFERFLARAYDSLGDAIILKGGFALELRLTRARTTKDVDIRVTGDLDELISRLEEAAARQKEDYLTFEFVEQRDFEEMLGDQIVYEGRRLRIQPKLAAQPFGGIFKLDISVADKLLLPPDPVYGTDLLEFIGIAPIEHRVYPVEAHVAEKLHAVTTTYANSQNGRLKDLVDLGLFATNFRFGADKLRKSIDATFEFRDTHPVPSELPAPPEFWESLYGKMRDKDDLRWDNLESLQVLCVAFLNPLLEKTATTDLFWVPDKQAWVDDGEETS